MAKKTRHSKKNKKTGFKYQSRSKQDYDRSTSESSGQFDAYVKDGIPIFKPHDGKNRIRVLPPTFEDPESFALTLLVHYGIGPGEFGQTYLCRKMLGDDEECAICDEYGRLIKEGESDDASDFKNKKRKATWLIDRKGEDKDPLFWAMPFGTWKDTILICKDEDGEVIELDHPEEGHDITFNKEGAAKKTKYTGIQLGKMRPIVPDEDEMGKILEFIQENPLNDVLVFYENEYLQSVLEGQVATSDDEDEDEDEDEEEKKPRRRRKSSKKSSSRDKDEDEDEDEDGKDEDDDEDDEDEDEDGKDEDDDEDDEDEDEDGKDEDDDEDDEDNEDRKKGSSASRLKDAARRAKKTTKSKKKTSKRRR